MRSFLAALRSLTLPYGGTGERIELDGVNGEIRVYDADGNLLIKIDGENGFQGYDPSGNVRIRMSAPFAGAYSAIQMWTTDAQETDGGILSLSTTGTRNRLVFAPGERNDKGSLEWAIACVSEDNSRPSMMQAVAITLDDVASLRPLIDLTGAAATAEQFQPHTVMYDAYYGAPNADVFEAPTKNGSYPRGVIERKRRTTDLVYGAVTGTEYQVIQLDPCTLISGRRYKLSFFMRSHAWNTAAAAVIVQPRIKDLSSTQRCEVSLIVDGASGRNGGICETIVDCPSEIAAGSHTFEAVIARVTGAGTLTMNASGTYPSYCAVEDVGATTNT